MASLMRRVSLRRSDANKQQSKSKVVRRRSCSIVKDSLYHFKRLSTCSWDDFDIDLVEQEYINSTILNLRDDTFTLNLYPSEGQPCSCVCTWKVQLLESIPGKTRRCKIVHGNRSAEIRELGGKISLSDEKVKIWGTINDNRKGGEGFELILERPAYGQKVNDSILEGYLSRGNRKKSTPLERTHEVIFTK